MHIESTSRSAVTATHRCFANTKNLNQLTVPITIAVDSLVEARHYPDGFIQPGTIVALHTGGANQDLWGPYVHDHAGGFGLDTAGAMIWMPIEVKDRYGAVATAVAGAALLAGLPVQINVALLPTLSADDDSEYTPLAADLPASFIDVQLGVA